MNSDELAKMVEMAKAYSGWEYAEYFRPEYIASVVTREDGHVESIAHCLDEQYGDFIAQAPATIVALAERVAELEALKARREEWQNPHDVLPPMTDGYRSDVVIMACKGQYHYKKDEWLINPQPFGWRAQDD